MTHLEDPAESTLDALAPLFAATEQAMGFVPNSMKTMAHLPHLPIALSLLVQAASGADLRPLLSAFAEAAPAPDPAVELLPRTATQLAAFAASVSAGCRYCQAHTSHTGHRLGATAAQYEDLLNFETSPHFTPAERAIVAFAMAAAAVPNDVTAEHFAALKTHFSEAQIVQLAGTVAAFGFLNRWNDTMATTLEAAPVAFGEQHLSAFDWTPGKHG
ncbi:MAG: carboxymuconolactone decarboxylase family protein [Pseudomonadota bacterium]